MKALAIAAITLTLSVFPLCTQAQSPAGSPPPAGGGNGPGGDHGHGQPGQQQRPGPEQMAARLMEKFDANKDGELSQSELTQALEDLRQHRPRGAWQGGQGGRHDGGTGGGSPGASQGSPGANQGGPAAGSGGERPAPPSADKAAARIIEKFSSDKKGLKQTELATALEERRQHRGEHGGGGPESGEHPDR